MECITLSLEAKIENVLISEYGYSQAEAQTFYTAILWHIVRHVVAELRYGDWSAVEQRMMLSSVIFAPDMSSEENEKMFEIAEILLLKSDFFIRDDDEE